MITWLKTYATAIKWIIFIALLIAAFVFGYHVRSLSAQRDAAAASAHEAKAIADALAAKAAETQANQAAGTQATQQLAAAQKDTKDNFQIIYRDVVRYVQTKPVPAVCDLDDAGLRAWNAANAGKPATASSQSNAAR